MKKNTENIQRRPALLSGTFFNVVFFFLLIALSSCTKPTGDTDEILQQYDAYFLAFDTNDIDVALAFYTDEIMQFPPNGSIRKGIAVIRDTMKSFREKNDYVLDEYSPPQIQVSGDLAVTYSTWAEHWTSKATGETTQESGRSLMEWQRQSDGEWKISKDMWNTGAAAPAMVSESAENVEQLLKTLSDGWGKTLTAKDPSHLERIWAPDFSYIRADGSVFNKEEGIAEFNKDTNTYTEVTLSNFKVRLYSRDFAITTGDNKTTGRDKDGKEFEHNSRFTNVWVKQNGMWQCGVGHASILK